MLRLIRLIQLICVVNLTCVVKEVWNFMTMFSFNSSQTFVLFSQPVQNLKLLSRGHNLHICRFCAHMFICHWHVYLRLRPYVRLVFDLSKILMRALILQLLIDLFEHSSTNKTQLSMWRPPHPSGRYCIALLIA